MSATEEKVLTKTNENLNTNQVNRSQIMAIGNQIRLSDSDPQNNLDMYSYITCENHDPDIIKKCNGIIFQQNEIILNGLPFIETYLSNDVEKISLLLNNLSSFRCFLSYEGITLRVFYYKNKWLVTTNKKLNAFRSKWSSKDSYGNMFKNSIDFLYSTNKTFRDLIGENNSKPYSSFLKTLNKNHVYLFKVQNTYDNRIVCNAPESPCTYHIGTFINNQFNLDDNIGVSKPSEKLFQNSNEIIDFVNKLSVHENIGLDLYDQDNNPYLIMNSEYHKLHSVRGNEPSIKFRYLQIRMDREKVDMLYYLYPKFADQFDNYENILYECAKKINYNYIKRFIKKKYITVPREEYQIMKQCHQWHLQDRERNRISLTKIIEVMNNQNASILNSIIRKYKNERDAQENRQQIRLLNPRAKSYGTPQIQPLRLEPVNKIESLKI